MSIRLLFASAVMLMLVACQAAGPNRAGQATGTAGAAEEITVTPLGKPGADAPAEETAEATATPEKGAEPTMDAEALAPAEAAAEDAAAPEPASADEPAAEAPAVPEVLKSPDQIACEKKGGAYANAGSSGGKVCVKLTRDGGKSCDREGDCEGLCLARSRTCSPFTPVFGCQEILQQDGYQVTQCTE